MRERFVLSQHSFLAPRGCRVSRSVKTFLILTAEQVRHCIKSITKLYLPSLYFHYTDRYNGMWCIETILLSWGVRPNMEQRNINFNSFPFNILTKCVNFSSRIVLYLYFTVSRLAEKLMFTFKMANFTNV